MLNTIIDDLFVTENKQSEKGLIPILNESGGTGEGNQSTTFQVRQDQIKSSLFTNLVDKMKGQGNKKQVTNPALLEETRKAYQKKLDMVNEITKS